MVKLVSMVKIASTTVCRMASASRVASNLTLAIISASRLTATASFTVISASRLVMNPAPAPAEQRPFFTMTSKLAGTVLLCCVFATRLAETRGVYLPVASRLSTTLVFARLLHQGLQMPYPLAVASAPELEDTAALAIASAWEMTRPALQFLIEARDSCRFRNDVCIRCCEHHYFEHASCTQPTSADALICFLYLHLPVPPMSRAMLTQIGMSDPA